MKKAGLKEPGLLRSAFRAFLYPRNFFYLRQVVWWVRCDVDRGRLVVRDRIGYCAYYIVWCGVNCCDCFVVESETA